MHVSGFLLVASLLMAVTAPTPPHTSTSFRVMTYNIRYNNPNDGEHAWPHRRDRVASTIRFNQVDLLGVQEALKDQVLQLDSLLTDFDWVGVGRDDGQEQGEFSPIFYRRNRYELVDQGTFWLSETPDVPGSKDWDAAITRIATWARFKDLQADTDVLLVNTHFDHRGEIARERSAALIVQKAQEIAGPLPIVITGDFNFTESAPGYANLTEAFHDAYYATQQPHHGPSGTFSGFEHGGIPLEGRIDFIFTDKRLTVYQHAILSDTWNGAYASDHLAVVATVQLP